jgi:SecD/SecF fusion protein
MRLNPLILRLRWPLLIVVMLVVVAGAVAFLANFMDDSSCEGNDTGAGVRLVYQLTPLDFGRPVSPGATARTAEILCDRLNALGVEDPVVRRTGKDEIVVRLPTAPTPERPIEQVEAPAQIHFYDFERNVIGNKRRPTTGLYQAVQVATRQKPAEDADNTTGTQYYLFRRNHQLRIAPGTSRKDLLSEFDGVKPKGDEIVTVPPGTVVVRAERPDKFPKDKEFNQFYVLRDNPELSGKDIKKPEQNFDPNTNEPIVTFEFTDKGREAFHDVTRRLAQRGQAQQIPGQPADASFQTFAVVLDREIITRPFINFNENPDGIDGRTGAQISGGFTVQAARDLAEFLNIGELPVNLTLISQTTGAES